MLSFLLAFLTVVRVFVRSRADTALDVLALRQQLGVLKRKRPRPRFIAPDRLFWVLLQQLWSRLAEALINENPTPSSAGIAPVSASIGGGGPDSVAGDRESARKFAS